MIYAKKGLLVRVIYLTVSLIVWLGSLGGRLFGSRVVILCYHGIKDRSQTSFREQMETVCNRTISLEKLVDTSQRRSSKPYVAITFDDAYENLLSNAWPVLERFTIPASVYVVTGYPKGQPGWLEGSGHPDEHEKLMTKEQLTMLAANPQISIGSHTHTHPRLAKLSRDEIQNELEHSKRTLETMIERNVVSLAYPHGSYNALVSEVARSCGFSQRLTLDERMADIDIVDGDIGRFSMNPEAWKIEFQLTIDGAYCWLFYFRRLIRSCKQWQGR